MIRAALAAVALTLAAGPLLAEACRDDRVGLRGPWGEARFTVEIADDSQSQQQGLMHREHLAQNAGMLFVYDSPQHARFWMRNTLIPLDMIFADPTGRVTRVHDNARPLDETVIDGGPGISHVLEINGGMAKAVGISVGDALQHPTIAPEQALWPCE